MRLPRPAPRLAVLLVAAMAVATGCVNSVDGTPGGGTGTPSSQQGASSGAPVWPPRNPGSSSAPTSPPVALPPATPQTLPSVPLVTGLVQDECLLTAAEFAALVDKPTRQGENAQVDLERQGPTRSCFYPTEPGDKDKYSGWINIYGSAGPTTTELIARINQNVLISRPLEVGLAGVFHPAEQIKDGGTIYAATEKYLVEIRVTTVIGDDARLIAAAKAALAKLPA